MNGKIKALIAGGILVFAAGTAIGVCVGRNSQTASQDTIQQVAASPTDNISVTEAQTEATTLAGAAMTEAVNVQLTMEKGESWQNGDKVCVKYEVKVKNNGDPIEDWKSLITFDTNFTIDQLWNGNNSVDGKVLTVTPADYNKTIETGGEIGFGFIGTFDTEPVNPVAKLYVGDTEIKTTENPLALAGDAGSTLLSAINAEPQIQATPASGTPVEQNGQLSVKGTQIVNKNGQAFVIKGVSTHGIAWFPQYINLESFRTLRDSIGANTVRLALYSSSGEGYTQSLHTKVDDGVKYATDLGMYVIIDWHILANGNPNTDKAAAEVFFKEMATKYQNYNNVLYEICNEPNGDVQWERDIKPYAESMISTIRSIDNDAIIIVGTPTWSQDVDVAAKSPIKADNIVYALHFYAATHKDNLRDKAQSAINAGLPLLVSEFGICDASGNGAIDETEANKWMAFLDKNGIGRVCWNLSNKAESSALISSATQKTSDWSDNELTAEGKWLKNAYTK
jgi:endoglucanase